MKIETLAIHAGRAVDAATGAVREPIHLSTTFERSVEGGYPRGFSYARADNPNRASLEHAVAALESGTQAVAFASGSAAGSAPPPSATLRLSSASSACSALRSSSSA